MTDAVSDLTPDVLRTFLEHINTDHNAELLDIALLLGAPRMSTHANLIALDGSGFTVKISGEGFEETLEHRFAQPITDAVSLRQALVDLMERTQPAASALPALDADALEAVIMARRSYPLEKLKPDPVPRAMLERCVNAARFAPNHGRTHPFRFVVISGERSKQRLCDAALAALPLAMPDHQPSWADTYRQMFLHAPAWIAIGMTPRREKPMPEWEELAAVSMAVQNLHLMAQAQGLGGLWVSGRLCTHASLAAHFGWGDTPDRLLGLFYLGFAKQSLAPRKYAALEDIVRWSED